MELERRSGRPELLRDPPGRGACMAYLRVHRRVGLAEPAGRVADALALEVDRDEGARVRRGEPREDDREVVRRLEAPVAAIVRRRPLRAELLAEARAGGAPAQLGERAVPRDGPEQRLDRAERAV